MEPLLGAVDLYDWIGPWGEPDELQAPPMIDGIFVGGLHLIEVGIVIRHLSPLNP